MNSSIHELTEYEWLFCKDPKKNFTRTRKLSFQKTVSATLSFRGGTLNHDLLDFSGLDSALPASSAFIQQRAKILPEAFETLFHTFTEGINQNNNIYKHHAAELHEERGRSAAVAHAAERDLDIHRLDVADEPIPEQLFQNAERVSAAVELPTESNQI